STFRLGTTETVFRGSSTATTTAAVTRARSTMAVIDSRQRKSLATIRVSLTPSTPSADTTQHRDAATVRNERRLRKTPEFGTRRLDLAPSGPRNTLRTCPL